MIPSLLDIVDHAITLLEERGWTQGCYAHDKNGNITSACSETATRFCMYGALCRATYNLSENRFDTVYMSPEYEKFEEITNTKIGYPNIVPWNDYPGRTKKEAINLLKEIRKELAK